MHVVGGHISQTGTKPATDLWSLGPGCTATWLVKTCLLLYLINSVYLTLHMFVSIGTLDWYVCRHCKWAPLPVGHLRHHCCAPICPLCCLLRPVQGTWELMCCQCTDSCWKCQKLKKMLCSLPTWHIQAYATTVWSLEELGMPATLVPICRKPQW